MARPVTGDASPDLEKGVVNVRVVRQKNDQVVVGRLALLVVMAVSGDARSVRLNAEWLWFRD